MSACVLIVFHHRWIVPEGIIHPVVSVSTLTWFIRYIYYRNVVVLILCNYWKSLYAIMILFTHVFNVYNIFELSLRRYLRLFVAIETCEDTKGVITRPVLRYHKGDYETGAKIPQGWFTHVFNVYNIFEIKITK
jgi:hypothetical protein